ncbi:MAG: glycosyl hydrolase family 88 [Pedosphaera sp.]|nr:glycosyl hydrolase family 88 [Pedosphaera sp.]
MHTREAIGGFLSTIAQIMNGTNNKLILAIMTGLLAAGMGCAQMSPHQSATVDLGPWPKNSSPQEIGKRVAERFVCSPHQNFGRSEPPKTITYPEVCAWYGALTFAQLSHDQDLSARLIKRFEPLLTPAESRMVPAPKNVDASVFGVVPFEIYIQTRDPRCLALGKKIADKQWDVSSVDSLSPEARAWVNRGLSPQTRFWIDDMFMIIALQTQAFRATGDTNYLNRAAHEMVTYLDELQQPNGLFYHAPDVHFFWGRGDGWMAVGMSELLRSLPANHPDRARILVGYKQMMASLLKYQDADGMWHQLIDQPDAWPETSSTAMFTFAMITGVKNGWLKQKAYAPAARKGWLGMIKYLNADGDTCEVCEGTNKKNNLNYYLTRGRNVGDMHGQAPFLWCASALLR